MTAQHATVREPAATPRVALVVGASRGIGAAIARGFAAAGDVVVLAGRDRTALAGVVEDIGARGGEAFAAPTDVTDAEAVREVVSSAMRRYGRLDAAVNLANDSPPPAQLADVDLERFDRAIATSVRGTFLALKYQIPAMIRGGGGAIVNVVSVAGVTALPGLAPYVAGKAGIIALTRVAALDYAQDGIRVNAVAPGPIRTHRIQAAGEVALARAAESVPLGRIGEADEVVSAVLWLCSPGASFVTGAVLPVDGGQLAGAQAHRRTGP